MQTLRELAARLGTTSRLLVRTVAVLLAATALYAMGPQLLAMVEESSELTDVTWWWAPIVVAAWLGGISSLWILLGAALPRTPVADIAMAHLSANAVANCVPAGPAVGGAVAVRLLIRCGSNAKQAATAITATGVVAAATLTALTPIAAMAAIIDAELPAAFEALAWLGAGLSALMALAAIAMLRGHATMRALVAGARVADRLVLARLGWPLSLELPRVLEQRAQLRAVLTSRWRRGVTAAALHWLFEAAALAAALAAVGATPAVSLLFLAYAATVVLRLVPITPGGLGFVEAGLVGALSIAGVAVSDAILAMLLYRVVTFWVPIPVGAVAYLVLRRRHSPRRRPAVATTPAPAEAHPGDRLSDEPG